FGYLATRGEHRDDCGYILDRFFDSKHAESRRESHPLKAGRNHSCDEQGAERDDRDRKAVRFRTRFDREELRTNSRRMPASKTREKGLALLKSAVFQWIEAAIQLAT